MSKIEVGRWSNQLRRMFGMAGVVDVSADLSPEISPVVVVEEPTVDLDFLKELRLCFTGNTIAGVVGNASKWRLRNPANSGTMIVVKTVEQVGIQAGILWQININQQTVDFPSRLLTTVPDSRWNTLGSAAQTTVGVVSSSNAQVAGPAGDIIAFAERAAQRQFTFPQAIPILPGAALDWGTGNADIDARMWICWTERALPVLER